MIDLLRRLRRGRDRRTWDPNAPHPFQDGRDGLAAFASGAGPDRGTQGIRQVATTNAFLRTAGCAVPGCGRPRDAEVHAAADG